MVLLTHSKPSDPQKAFRMAEKLKRKGVELITIAIHMEKRSTNINQQYKALASSHASAHSYDLNGILTHVNDIVLNVCDLHACPKGRQRYGGEGEGEREIERGREEEREGKRERGRERGTGTGREGEGGREGGTGTGREGERERDRGRERGTAKDREIDKGKRKETIIITCS